MCCVYVLCLCAVSVCGVCAVYVSVCLCARRCTLIGAPRNNKNNKFRYRSLVEYANDAGINQTVL